MKKLLILSALLLVACQKPTKISEKEVMDTFETFFEVLDNDLGSFDAMVTDDFFIFENSRRYSKEEFIDFVKRIIVEPNGVYWFLHTLILLYLSCFISYRIFNYNIKSKFLLFIIINILFVYLGLVKLNSLIFFICGLIANINGSKNFLLKGLDILMLLLLTLTFVSVSGLPTDNLTSLAFNLLIFFLFYNFCNYFKDSLKIIQLVGKNTLIILVLHPFFLLLMKLLSGFIIRIDSLGILYSIITVTSTCLLCILCAFILDKIKLSYYLFGKKYVFIT